MVEGIIKFLGYRTEKISYNLKQIVATNDDQKEAASISPEFMLHLINKTASTELEQVFFNVLIGVRIGFGVEEMLPFSTAVVLRGFFRYDKEVAYENTYTDLNRFLLTNGSAILFPYLRSILTDITSKSDHNPIILPTINFHKFIENRDMEKTLLDSSKYVDKI